MNLVNIAGYKFIKLTELPALKQQLLDVCNSLQLKGTILLSDEGINQMLAGSQDAIDAYKEFLANTAEFNDISFRESISTTMPFSHLVIRIKPEIITMGMPEINPTEQTGKHLSPQVFKQWLQEKRDIVVLDTRNDFEVEMGTFVGATNLHLETFRQFPDAVSKLDPSLKKKTIVTFCTGGIRCEKATAAMMQQGFEDVYQLEGGILNYFSECGGEYYQGECFVFDYRVAVDGDLQVTGTTQCKKCHSPVTLAQQQLVQYQEGVCCPKCFNIDKANTTDLEALI